MHAQQESRAVVDGRFVVGDARAVGGADFAQRGVRLRHHVGDAERAADFDQFSAGDDDFAALGQRVQREQNGGGVVVDDDGGDGGALLLRTAESSCPYVVLGDAIRQKLLEQAIDVDVALTAFAGREIEFEIRVCERRFADVVERGVRPAERVPDWCAG